MPSRPLVIAHRGASARETENSLAAFRLAAELGADAVELDVHATADGHLVVHHDEMAGRHHVAHCSFREVRSHHLANGEPVPTLEEALAVIVPGMIAFIEIKAMPPRLDEKFLSILERTGASLDRFAVHSFDHLIVHRLGERKADLRRGVLVTPDVARPLAALNDADATDLWPQVPMVDRQLVDAAHRAEARVLAWTVDDAEAMRRLVDLGVDGLCTNHPDRARQVVDSLAR